MQADTDADIQLQCCECKAGYTSAAKLLQHFAEHVLKQNGLFIRKKVRSSTNRLHRKRKTGTIVEQVLKTSESSSELSPNDSSTVSAFSEQQDSDTSTVNSSPARTSTLDKVDETDNESSCKLAKFDLQKRLESCVGNLSSKQGGSITVNMPDHDSLIHKKGDLSVVQVGEKCSSDANNTQSYNSKAVEDFNPLKFCVITMEDNEEIKAASSCSNSPKKITSRKQLVPKKIEQKLGGLRQLAPKLDNLTKSQTKELSVMGSVFKKKYACHLCTKVFGWSTDLKRHILVHTGERPFKCKTCLATFTRNFLLQKHQSKVHPCKPKEIPPTNSDDVLVSGTGNLTAFEKELQDTSHENVDAEQDDYDDDDDEDKLIITEEVEEQKPSKSVILFQNKSDSKWPGIKSNSERRCSDINQSDIFTVAPMKVATV